MGKGRLNTLMVIHIPDLWNTENDKARVHCMIKTGIWCILADGQMINQ